MANTLKFGNGEWYGKKDTILAYNSENNNYKPLPFDFSRGSSATVVNKDGLIETVGSGEPRIDYKDNTKGALLLEPSRTNVITYSYTQSAGVWYPYSAWTVSDNSQISPKGILDASSLTENLTNGYHSGYYQPAINNGYTGSYTISCFAKYNGRNIALSPKGATERTVFNLANGTISQLGGGGVTAKIQDYGNGWYRCIVTCSFSNQNVNFEHLLANNNSLQYQGDGTSGVYIYGCQAEQGSYATSYIPTSGSAVTRVQESSSQTVPDGVIGQTEGTILFDYTPYDVSASTAQDTIPFALSFEGSSGNAIFLNDYNGNLNLNVNVGGVAQSSISFGSLVAGQTFKIGIGYASNDLVYYVNGVQIGIDTSLSLPTCNQIKLNGFTSNVHINKINVNDFKLYNTRLSNSELQALTQE